MADALTLYDVYRRLDTACRQAGSQSAWGKQHGMTVQFVSAVLNARKAPSPRMLAALGLQEVTRFVEVASASTTQVDACRNAAIARSAGTEGTALLLSDGASQGGSS